MFGWKRQDDRGTHGDRPACIDYTAKPPGPRPLPPLLAAIRLQRLKPAPVVMQPAAAAASLLAWLQTEGFDGWLTVREVDEAWRGHREDLDAVDIPVELIRENLLNMAGVQKTRRRLEQDPQFAEVKRRLIAEKRSTEKPVLFYIPPLADPAPLAAPSRAAGDPGAPRTPRAEGGPVTGRKAAKRAATPVKRGDQDVSTSPMRRAA